MPEYKYVSKMGHPAEADACYVTMSPTENSATSRL